jgi:hypothetical protein
MLIFSSSRLKKRSSGLSGTSESIDPLISHGALVENVSKRLNREFDQRYVKKLTDKIERQMLIEVDRTKIERRNGIHARKLPNGPRPHQSRYRPRPLASWFVSRGRFSPLGPVGIWGDLHQCSN